MTPHPTVSVVIPALNNAGTIGAMLESLAAQDYSGAWEVIVADNGSTDATAATTLQWTCRLPDLRIVPCGETRGAAHALNVGTRAARGPLIAYCNADDVVSAGWLSAIVAALHDHELVTGPIDLALLNAFETYGWRGVTGWERLPDWHSFLPAALGCNLAVRRNVFDSVNGFDETMTIASDFDFEWRAQLLGSTLGFAPGAIVHWRSRSSPFAYFKAHVGYGRCDAQLFSRFASHGMQRHLWAGLIRITLVLPSCPLLLLRSQRYRWLAGAGSAIGRVIGSWRNRVLYL